jgi:hypothetical protein
MTIITLYLCACSYLSSNGFTSLPSGIFQGLSALQLMWVLLVKFCFTFVFNLWIMTLYLCACAVTSDPTDLRHCLLVSSRASQVFRKCECLHDLVYRAVWICRAWLYLCGRSHLDFNSLEPLPSGIFQGLSLRTMWVLVCNLHYISVQSALHFCTEQFQSANHVSVSALCSSLRANGLTSLPAGIFQGFPALWKMWDLTWLSFCISLLKSFQSVNHDSGLQWPQFQQTHVTACWHFSGPLCS